MFRNAKLNLLKSFRTLDENLIFVSFVQPTCIISKYGYIYNIRLNETPFFNGSKVNHHWSPSFHWLITPLRMTLTNIRAKGLQFLINIRWLFVAFQRHVFRWFPPCDCPAFSLISLNFFNNIICSLIYTLIIYASIRFLTIPFPFRGFQTF